jgi:7-alpha-hydroxysteroid dehydrogenase
MISAGRGSIVNISSAASLMPGDGPYANPGTPTTFAYGGNKAALEHLTRAVAFEVAPFGISVNALSPTGAVNTPGLVVNTGRQDGTDVPDDWATPENFAEATLRLALATPDKLTGTLQWSEDLLHPERPPRGFVPLRPE